MRLLTWLFGQKVGEDRFKNSYYQSKRWKRAEKNRRWVMYKDKSDPTRICAHWHPWLHYMSDTVPSPHPSTPTIAFEKDRQANATGTHKAYAPSPHMYKEKKIHTSWRPK